MGYMATLQGGGKGKDFGSPTTIKTIQGGGGEMHSSDC